MGNSVNQSHQLAKLIASKAPADAGAIYLNQLSNCDRIVIEYSESNTKKVWEMGIYTRVL